MFILLPQVYTKLTKKSTVFADFDIKFREYHRYNEIIQTDLDIFTANQVSSSLEVRNGASGSPFFPNTLTSI